MSALKPCPFCTRRATVERVGRDWYRVAVDHTNECVLFGTIDIDYTQDDDGLHLLIKEWNTRRSPELVITDEMLDAGADAYHDARRAAEDRHRKRDTGREYFCVPDHWLREVFAAMVSAQDGEDAPANP